MIISHQMVDYQLLFDGLLRKWEKFQVGSKTQEDFCRATLCRSRGDDCAGGRRWRGGLSWDGAGAPEVWDATAVVPPVVKLDRIARDSMRRREHASRVFYDHYFIIVE
jgi:hypothetical protein